MRLTRSIDLTTGQPGGATRSMNVAEATLLADRQLRGLAAL